MNNRGNDKLVEMMSLAEEINRINTKVRQLVEDLHGSTGVLINLQELTTKLTKKVGILSNGVNGYKPTKVVEDGIDIAPSKSDGINEPHRIVPTPENFRDYMPEEPVRKVKQIESIISSVYV